MIRSIQTLEEQLAQAKRNAEPVVVELTSEDKDQRTYASSNGTVRVDLLGGTAPVYEEAYTPLRQVHASPWAEMSDDVGKVKSEDAVQRTSKLKSGAVRQDLK